MAAQQSRKDRYVFPAEDTTWFYMEDAEEAYKKKHLDTFGYMYELNKSEKECVEIFRKDRQANSMLNALCKDAEKKLGTNDVYKIVKRAYSMESPLYRTFNMMTRGLLTFFDWEKFNFKGMWLLLYKALLMSESKAVLPNQVYRGCAIPFQAKVGSVIKFKQFTSTSVSENVVESFIDLPQCSTIFTIKIEAGLSLADCSEFPEEQEFLLRPHDGLEVTNVKKERNGLTMISLEQKSSLLF